MFDDIQVTPSIQNAKNFLSLTPAKVQEMTGKKMTLKEKIAFKLAQKKVKQSMNKAGSINTKDKKQMLRLWIIFAVVAVGLSIIGWFIPFIWLLSGLAWLASLVFFVLWIIAVSE